MDDPVWLGGRQPLLRLLPTLLLVGNKGTLGKEVCGSKTTGHLVGLELLQVAYRMRSQETRLQLFLCLRYNLVRDFSCCQSEVKALSEEKESLKQHLDSSSSTVAILQDEKSKLQQEVAESKKEQDDLLVLLADQDQKLSALKIKLKDLGVPVSKTMAQVSSRVRAGLSSLGMAILDPVSLARHLSIKTGLLNLPELLSEFILAATNKR